MIRGKARTRNASRKEPASNRSLFHLPQGCHVRRFPDLTLVGSAIPVHGDGNRCILARRGGVLASERQPGAKRHLRPHNTCRAQIPGSRHGVVSMHCAASDITTVHHGKAGLKYLRTDRSNARVVLRVNMSSGGKGQMKLMESTMRSIPFPQ